MKQEQITKDMNERNIPKGARVFVRQRIKDIESGKVKPYSAEHDYTTFTDANGNDFEWDYKTGEWKKIEDSSIWTFIGMLLLLMMLGVLGYWLLRWIL